MHDNRSLVEARIDRFMAERLAPNAWRNPQPLTLAAWGCPGEPVPFTEASRQVFRPFKTDEMWGAPWATVWFRVTGTVPPQWNNDDGPSRPEVVLDPGFTVSTPGFQAEGMVYRADGTVIKALEPRNQWVPLDAGPGESLELYLEAASNPDVIEDFSFAPTPLGDKATAAGPGTRMRNWSRPGRPCCCSSSMTSCPAHRSPGFIRKRSGITPTSQPGWRP